MKGKALTKNPDVVYRKIANEAILVPVRRSAADLESVYTLNDTGARIWELLGPERQLPQIVDAIVREFEVDPAEAEKDVKELLARLTEIGLIRQM